MASTISTWLGFHGNGDFFSCEGLIFLVVVVAVAIVVAVSVVVIAVVVDTVFTVAVVVAFIVVVVAEKKSAICSVFPARWFGF